MAFFKNIFQKKSVEELKENSRLDYEKATKSHEDKVSLGVRLRLARRAKVNIEKTFLEGAKLTEEYEALKEIRLGQNEPIDDLKEPKVAEPFKLIETDKGVVISFIPEEYSEEIFKLGCSYQKCLITADKALLIGQSIFDRICLELDINKEITVLDFLTDEDEET